MAIINVIRDYDWTTIPRGSGYRNNAPRVRIKSYKIKSSAALNRIVNYTQAFVATNANTFYDQLYSDVSEPEDVFRIPYLGDTVRSFSNEYGDTFQSAFLGSVDQVLMGAAQFGGAARELISGMVASVKGEGNSNPGSYIETPKLYQYSQNDSPLEISFILDNTLNSDNSKNTELVEKLTRINRPRRENSIIMEPPRIYEITLEGVRYMRWAYCSNFTVRLLGAKRMIDNKIIPEGYQIDMSFTSLTTEVSNFMDKI